MIVGVDVDGVLRDFYGSLERTYLKYYHDHIIKDPPSFQLHELYPIGYKIYDFAFEEHAGEVLGFADAYRNAEGFMRMLHKFADIVIITSQPTKRAKVFTFAWLQRADILQHVDSVVIVQTNGLLKKHHIGVNYIIDDYPPNLMDFPQSKVIVFDQVWNKGLEWGKRCYSYDEILKYLQGRMTK
ncbi:hypothetical protein [Sulfuricurvum sp.]|uniref:5' nucleotidase, NT5C type n=1 Tax=Sulfuricurvum sp. TaxID=2025608 RepID=UPI00356503F1